MMKRMVSLMAMVALALFAFTGCKKGGGDKGGGGGDKAEKSAGMEKEGGEADQEKEAKKEEESAAEQGEAGAWHTASRSKLQVPIAGAACSHHRNGRVDQSDAGAGFWPPRLPDLSARCRSRGIGFSFGDRPARTGPVASRISVP